MSKPTIVLVHGFWGGAAHWAKIIVELSRMGYTDIRAVENYLKLTQMIVERQVMLEAKILEVSLNEEFQAGINWSAFGGNNNRF